MLGFEDNLDMEMGRSVDKVMEIDESFLEGYRDRRGKPSQSPTIEPDFETPDQPEPTKVDPHNDQVGERGGGDQTSTPVGDQSDQTSAGQEADHLPASGEEGAVDAADDAHEFVVESSATPPQEHDGASNEPVPVSLQKTDHQEAVQNAARGGSGSNASAANLPVSGFKVHNLGSATVPSVKGLPGALLEQLRDVLISAAVRELGVTHREAKAYVNRLSQSALVVAFLSAQLDSRLDVDAATARASELYRSRDPLLGGVLERLDSLEANDAKHASALEKMAGKVTGVAHTTGALEHAMSYFIADRVENLARGATTGSSVPVLHKSALAVREMLRSETQKQARLEREQAGRPIR